MLKLYIKLGLRNLLKSRLYSIMNVIGLVVGFTSFISIYIFNSHELSFDDFHKKSKNIYRLWDTFNSNNRKTAIMPYKWTEYLATEFSEIKEVTSIQTASVVVKKNDKAFAQENVIATDTSFFRIFDFPIVRGNPSMMLSQMNNVVLTPASAIKYFGSISKAMGQTMEIGLYGHFEPFVVAGIMQCPKNSHLQFEFIIPFDLMKKHSFNPPAYENWSVHFVFTYMLMEENFDRDVLKSKFKDFLFRHAGERLRDKYTPDVQALSDIYLKSDQEFDSAPRGNISNIQILSVVAFLIVFMAIINFVNLSTAQSLKRAGEVSLRKIFGSKRRQLIYQFLMEATFVSVFSMLLSLTFFLLILPYFQYFTGKEFGITTVFSLSNLLLFMSIAIVTGILAGLYPAFVLSSFKPINILRSRNAGSSANISARKALVIFQFLIAIILIISTGVVQNQVNYMLNRSTGMDMEQVIVINDGGAVSSDNHKMKLLKNTFENHNTVKSISSTSSYPGIQAWSIGFLPDGYEGEKSASMPCIFTDHDFLKTYQVEILKGRDLNQNISSDSSGLLINETAMKLFATKDSTWLTNPINKTIEVTYLRKTGRVVGVFKDFHFESLHREIKPLILLIYPPNFFRVQVRLNTNMLQASLNEVEQIWSGYFPNTPFDYKFVDQQFASNYKSDQQLRKLFGFFSAIAIIIAVIGLFGLAAFVAKSKTKEISIRKVLGATEVQLVKLLSNQFLKLVLIGNIIAVPISYLLMESWLSEFAYRINMPWIVFVISFIISAGITYFTTGFHAIKTAKSNPADTLSQE